MMPERLSPAAKDLISKMLQVDPSKRIKIYDIKNHPWLRSHVPIYYRTGGSFFT
jgi:5'-AMP-activated protein kinase catalytic alpha subunit